MRYIHHLSLLVAAALSFGFYACSSDEEEEKPVVEEHSDFTNANDNKEGSTYVNTEAGVPSSKFVSRMEMPKLQSGDILIVHQATDMTGSPVNYSVGYSPTDHHSRWVAFRFDNDMKARKVARKDYNIRPQYPQDPLCAATVSSDASFNGHDHGHLCASADRLCSREANDQTFYMSNMSPQMGNFNQDYWTNYEGFVQTLGRSCGPNTSSTTSWADTLYVVKGGTINSGNILKTIKVDGYNMPVPKYYYMALLKVKNGNYTAIAFWIEHKDYDTKNITNVNADIAAHAITIDKLEEYTGIDFFCNLPGSVEKSVEAVCLPSAWGL